MIVARKKDFCFLLKQWKKCYFIIEFYFNFKKGARTLSLTDLEKGSDTLDSLPPKRTWCMLSPFLMLKNEFYIS